MILCAVYAHQLFGPHVVQNPLSVLAVMATLHNCKKQLRGIVLGKKLVNEKVADIFTNFLCASIIWNQFCKRYYWYILLYRLEDFATTDKML